MYAEALNILHQPKLCKDLKISCYNLRILYNKLLSLLLFDFDSILGSFFSFWGPNGLFLGLGSPNID